MTYWNYRLCKETYKAGTEFEESEISLREVYYTTEGKITAVTERAVGICGEDITAIKTTMKLIADAINKEVVDLDTIVYARNQ